MGKNLHWDRMGWFLLESEMEGWEGINICRAGVSYITLGWQHPSSWAAPTQSLCQNWKGELAWKWRTKYSRGMQQSPRGQQGVCSFLFRASFNIPPFCFQLGQQPKVARISVFGPGVLDNCQQGKAGNQTPKNEDNNYVLGWGYATHCYGMFCLFAWVAWVAWVAWIVSAIVGTLHWDEWKLKI